MPYCVYCLRPKGTNRPRVSAVNAIWHRECVVTSTYSMLGLMGASVFNDSIQVCVWASPTRLCTYMGGKDLSFHVLQHTYTCVTIKVHVVSTGTGANVRAIDVDASTITLIQISRAALVNICQEQVYNKVDKKYMMYFASWLKGGSKEKCAYISHVAQVSDTAQVTRQISLLGLIA